MILAVALSLKGPCKETDLKVHTRPKPNTRVMNVKLSCHVTSTILHKE